MNSDALKWLVLFIVVAGASGTIYYKYQDTRPCAHPIEYRIGANDSRFGVSNEVLKQQLLQAAEMWNKAAGRTLFTFVASGGVPVSLVFDDRQKTANLGESITAAQDLYDLHKARVEAEKAAYQKNHSPQALATLNADIDALNAEGRALNAKVAAYNTTAGEAFEAGKYHADSAGATIELYEFTSRTQLTHIAAHEFGHALGLDHNDDPASIMYPESKGTSLTLSSKDLAALNALCGLK